MATNCCARNYFRDQNYFYPDPDSDPPQECPTLVDGTGIINIQSAFAGVAGFYLQTDASNAVELDAGGSVLQTIPVAANHYVTAFPMDLPFAYDTGGPLGPYIFSSGSWQAIIDATVQGVSANPPYNEATFLISSPIGYDTTNIVVEISYDDGATWEPAVTATPLTPDQLSGVEAVPVADSTELFLMRLILTDENDCSFTSAVYTFSNQ